MVPRNFLSDVPKGVHVEGHPKNVHSGKFKCECGKILTCKRNFLAHKQMHEVQEPVECKVCGKTVMGSKRILGRHMRQHKIDRRPCLCDICGRVMPNWQSMVKHRDAHKRETESKVLGKATEKREADAHKRGDGEGDCRVH